MDFAVSLWIMLNKKKIHFYYDIYLIIKYGKIEKRKKEWLQIICFNIYKIICTENRFPKKFPTSPSNTVMLTSREFFVNIK